MVETKKKSFINIIIYLVIWLIGSLIFNYLIAYIYSKNTSFTLNEILNGNLDSNLELLTVSTKVLMYTNFIVYLLMFIGLIINDFKYLKRDLLNFKNKLAKNIIYLVFGGASLYLFSYLINLGLSKLGVSMSNNQISIENMLILGSKVITFFSVIIFAPLVEELIYRKSIYSLSNNKVVYYIVSILAFSLPHMLSTTYDLKTFILGLIPYLFSGFILSLIYDHTKNIYVSTLAHIINNLIAFIIIII